MMNSTLGLILLWLVLLFFIWISIAVAREDGFFTSLCSLIVLFIAYQFTRFEWGFFYQFISGNGMSKLQTISVAYWIGFLIIIGPGMIVARLLAKPKVPFPPELERYGTILIGLCAGILIFATLIHWIIHLDFIMNAMRKSIKFFEPLFVFLGYRKAPFG